MGSDDIRMSDGTPHQSLLEILNDGDNVTGAEVLPPADLNGYLDEPRLAFGLWVGESGDDAELQAFEVEGGQIHELAEAFQQASDHARELEDGEYSTGDVADDDEREREVELPPLLKRMKPFSDVRKEARQIHQWVGEVKRDLETMQWVAAGGRGSAVREATIEKIDSQIRNLQSLRDQVQGLEDPRELGAEARELRAVGEQPGEDDGD